MSKRIEDSPLKRRKLTLGAEPKEETATKEETKEPSKHTDIKDTKHNNGKVRTTIYVPEDLFLRFKVYAVRHKEDMSGILTRQIEKLLAGEE